MPYTVCRYFVMHIQILTHIKKLALQNYFKYCTLLVHVVRNDMARNFGHARAVNIQTWENLKQYGYTKL